MGERSDICLSQDLDISLRRDVLKSAGFSIFLKATDLERATEKGFWSILALDASGPFDDVVFSFLEERNPPIEPL